MMEGELNHLERKVEDARARLNANLDRLRDPETFVRFKSDLLSEVHHSKDEWVQRGTDTFKTGARRILDEVKDRAAANPMAAVAIGAGLLWHFAKHPPITTLLVGAGVFGLIRTDPRYPAAGAETVSRAGELAGTMKEAVQQKAAEFLSGAGDAIENGADVAGTVTEQIGEWAGQARDTAEEFISNLAAGTHDLARRASQIVNRVAPDEGERDTLLLGAAAVALAAAVGIAYHRRTD